LIAAIFRFAISAEPHEMFGHHGWVKLYVQFNPALQDFNSLPTVFLERGLVLVILLEMLVKV
jgi:hypothetical protein